MVSAKEAASQVLQASVRIATVALFLAVVTEGPPARRMGKTLRLLGRDLQQ